MQRKQPCLDWGRGSTLRSCSERDESSYHTSDDSVLLTVSKYGFRGQSPNTASSDRLAEVLSSHFMTSSGS